MFPHCPGTKGQRDELKILLWDGPGFLGACPVPSRTWDRKKKVQFVAFLFNFFNFFVPFGKEKRKKTWLGWDSNTRSLKLKPIALTIGPRRAHSKITPKSEIMESKRNKKLNKNVMNWRGRPSNSAN
jgi:hypothetical protein